MAPADFGVFGRRPARRQLRQRPDQRLHEARATAGSTRASCASRPALRSRSTASGRSRSATAPRPGRRRRSTSSPARQARSTACSARSPPAEARAWAGRRGSPPTDHPSLQRHPPHVGTHPAKAPATRTTSSDPATPEPARQPEDEIGRDSSMRAHQAVAPGSARHPARRRHEAKLRAPTVPPLLAKRLVVEASRSAASGHSRAHGDADPHALTGPAGDANAHADCATQWPNGFTSCCRSPVTDDHARQQGVSLVVRHGDRRHLHLMRNDIGVVRMTTWGTVSRLVHSSRT